MSVKKLTRKSVLELAEQKIAEKKKSKKPEVDDPNKEDDNNDMVEEKMKETDLILESKDHPWVNRTNSFTVKQNQIILKDMLSGFDAAGDGIGDLAVEHGKQQAEDFKNLYFGEDGEPRKERGRIDKDIDQILRRTKSEIESKVTDDQDYKTAGKIITPVLNKMNNMIFKKAANFYKKHPNFFPFRLRNLKPDDKPVLKTKI